MEATTHPFQVEIYRKMTSQQKYDVICSLIESARRLKEAYLRSVHSDWTEDQIQKALRDWFLYARQ
jgi:hypothetical protein